MSGVRQVCAQVGGVNLRTLINSAVISSQPNVPNSSTRLAWNETHRQQGSHMSQPNVPNSSTRLARNETHRQQGSHMSQPNVPNSSTRLARKETHRQQGSHMSQPNVPNSSTRLARNETHRQQGSHMSQPNVPNSSTRLARNETHRQQGSHMSQPNVPNSSTRLARNETHRQQGSHMWLSLLEKKHVVYQTCGSSSTNQEQKSQEQCYIQNTVSVDRECHLAAKEKFLRGLEGAQSQGTEASQCNSDFGNCCKLPTQEERLELSGNLPSKLTRIYQPMIPVQRLCHLKSNTHANQLYKQSLPYHTTCFHTPQRIPSSFSVPFRTLRTSSHPEFVEMNSAAEFEGPTVTEMTSFLYKHKLGCSVGYTCLIVQCPFCNEDAAAVKGSEKPSGAERNVYINKTTGWTTCHCAKAKGSWEKFENSITIWKKKKKTAKPPLSMLPISHDEELQDDSNGQTDKLHGEWNKAVELSQCDGEYTEDLKRKFGIEKLSTKTLETYQVKVDKSTNTLLLPVYGAVPNEKQLHGIVKLEVEYDEYQQGHVKETNLYRNGYTSGLFGYNHIKPGETKVILTQSALDALAVHQGTSKPVVSLPHHASGSPTMPQEILPLLEPVKTMTLWFNNDMRSWEACKQFAKKLNSKRCHLIRPLEDHPSPLTALNNNKYLGPILKKAVPVSHKFITSFRTLRQEVLGELCNADQVAGVKVSPILLLPRMEALFTPEQVVKRSGHRCGELTVFTGPTGSGKTTFMAEYSLDLCMQGVNTLWGSFEIQNVRLAKVMLTQFTGLNLADELDKFDESADNFEKLPLYFMAFHGEQSLQRVLEAMNHACYVHDIHHVIIDNLQFMVGYSDKQTALDRVSMYDRVISAFCKFATNNNCHVSLVIHPRKEREGDGLQTSSIFGSAKTSQEAVNVLILQDHSTINAETKSRKYIQITKNRFDGDCGKIPLYFNKDTLMMSKTPPPRKTKKTKDDMGKDDGPGLLDIETSEVFKEYDMEDEFGFKE